MEGIIFEFPKNYNLRANQHKTTYCLQLTVCTTLLSNDLVTGHVESVDYKI